MSDVGSAFSGDGLLDFGLTLAGWKHAFLCESEPDRRAILSLRWPGVPIYRDVRDVDGGAPRPVLFAGGFPCKGGSTAGKRTGLDHPETALWREMARVIRVLRPRLVLVENVANLLTVPTDAPGRAWGDVQGDLAALGYVCAWDCLPAAAFGAPHLRDRVYCIAADTQSPNGQGTWPGREALGRAVTDDPRTPADASLEEGLGGGDDRGESNGRADAGRGPASDSGRAGWQERYGAESGQAQQPAADPRSIADPDASAGLNEFVGDANGIPGRADTSRAGDRAVPPDPQRNGVRQQSEPERGGESTGEPAAVGQDAHPDQDGREAERIGATGVQPRHDADGRREVDWGDYEPAAIRWEAIQGPAPEPLLRGVDARGARKVVRSRLSALGDGVQVQAGHFLGAKLMELAIELDWA